MFEIKNEEALFRLSFVERLEEPEDRELDLIICWLEIKDNFVNVGCECELSVFDLHLFRDKLKGFYSQFFENPEPVCFEPRMPVFEINCLQLKDSDSVGFNFIVRPELSSGWVVNGGIIIDQSYFPSLLQGIESILDN